MKVRNLCLSVLLCVLLAVSAQAEDRTVTVDRGDGTSRSAAVSVPDGASLWCVSFDSAGMMLNAQTVDGTRVQAADGTAEVRFLLLNDGLVPQGPAVRTGLDSATWEEPYQEGVAALNREHYGQAVSSFTTAIGMDPSQAAPYVGRGDARIGLGETPERLTEAQSDYEQASTLDAANPDAWLGLADVAIRQGEYDRAEEILTEAAEATGNNAAVTEKLQEVQGGNIRDSSGHVRRRSSYDAEGNLQWWHDISYDEQGRQSLVTAYDASGNELNRVEKQYDDKGKHLVDCGYENESGALIKEIFETLEENEDGRRVKTTEQWTEDGVWVTRMIRIDLYNAAGKHVRFDEYNVVDGQEVFFSYRLFEYDADGKCVKEIQCDPDGTVLYFYTRQYDEQGRDLRWDFYSSWDGEMHWTGYELYCYENDTLVRTERYDADGNLTDTTEYTH